jgi:hypothetical protein
LRLSDKATVEVFLKEVPKGFRLDFGGAIYGTKRRVLTFLDIDVVVEEWVEVGKLVGLGFTEDVQEVVIFGRDLGSESVEFISGKLVSLSGAEGSVRIGGPDLKYTGLEFVDPGNHSEGRGVHEADDGGR